MATTAAATSASDVKLHSMPVSAILQLLTDNGIDVSRPQVRADLATLCGHSLDDGEPLRDLGSVDMVSALKDHPDNIICKAVTGSLAVPRWDEFTQTLKKIFEDIRREVDDGSPADYIPILAEADRDWFAVSVCTVDGQQFNYGDIEQAFSIQSCTKPIMYATAVEDRGLPYVHRTVGFEPSGLSFNEVSLNSNRKPHNPYINSGAIATGALIGPGLDNAAKFRHYMKKLQEISGVDKIGFSHATYLCEHETAWRNNALVHFMDDAGVFPRNCKPLEALDFYLQCCSIEVTTDIAATIAGTLANGGVCPLTGHAALSPVTVKSTISLMFSCGMYDYSGTWMSEVGLPAKSGVAGLIYVVVPHVMGIAVFAPPLDGHGNSVRGVELCKRLLQHYPFGIFDHIVSDGGLTNLMSNTAGAKPAGGAAKKEKKSRATKASDSKTVTTKSYSPHLGAAADEDDGASVMSSLQLTGAGSVAQPRRRRTSVDTRSRAFRIDKWLQIFRHVTRAHRLLRRLRVWSGLPITHEDLAVLQAAAASDPDAPEELLTGPKTTELRSDIAFPESYQLYKEYRANFLQSSWTREDEAADFTDVSVSAAAGVEVLRRQLRPSDDTAPIEAVQYFLELNGISVSKDFPRVATIWNKILEKSNKESRTISFSSLIVPGARNNVILKAFVGGLAMQNFRNFVTDIIALYEDVKRNERGGQVFSGLDIEELNTANPEHFGISVCTVDGQMLNIGDVDVEFPLMGAVRPLLYALACKDVGIQEVNRWVGVEPTAADTETFNLIPAHASGHGGGHTPPPKDQDKKSDADAKMSTPDPVMPKETPAKKESKDDYLHPEPDRAPHPRPFNAFLDSGALAISSLIGRAHYPPEQRLFHDNGSRFSHMLQHFRRWCGNRRVGFNNSVFLAQKQKRLKTLAISYYAKGMGVYPAVTDPTDAAHYLFQAEAVEMNCKDLAVIAATFANIGVCPLTQERCLEPQVMRAVMSLMYNSGLGPFSGHFMFTAGIPSSSGTSGAHLIVIPGLMGIVVYSPKLNNFGIPHRGVRFCELLTSKYRVNLFDQLVYADQAVEIDATTRSPAAVTMEQSLMQYELCTAASKGDVHKVKDLLQMGADPNIADYDVRTALHIACSDGQEEIVKVLLEAGANALISDRWGSTPYDDACRRGYFNIVRMLEEDLTRRGQRIPARDSDASHSSAGVFGIKTRRVGSARSSVVTP